MPGVKGITFQDISGRRQSRCGLVQREKRSTIPMIRINRHAILNIPPSGVLLFDQRYRRWSNIETTLGRRLEIAWMIEQTQKTRDFDPMLVYCWSTVSDAGPTLNQYRSISRVWWER